MSRDQTPVAVSLSQWPEGRSFDRIYHNDPARQARFAMALIGFRDVLEMELGSSDDMEAIDVVLNSFRKKYPEFMSTHEKTDSECSSNGAPYRVDDRLNSLMPEDP